MNKTSEKITDQSSAPEGEILSIPSEKKLQDNRAAVLEKHLNHQKEEKSVSKITSERELEIKKIKEEISKIKNEVISPSPLHQVQPSREYELLVENILSNFRNDINSPINSIEYSSENLQLEYQRLLANFNTLSESAYPAEALGRALKYVDLMTVQTDEDAADSVITRERKKKFSALLEEYNILNSKRAAEYFVSSGIFYVDSELFWILSQPKGEVLFEIMISLLSIKQSFEVLNSAKTRARYITANLIIPSEKEMHSHIQDEINEEEKRGDKILKRKFISDEIVPVIKMVIILLNLYAIAKMIFHF